MRKVTYITLSLFALSFLASCQDFGKKEVCIKCTKIQDETLTQEFCSDQISERNDFIVEWTHADYNCEVQD